MTEAVGRLAMTTVDSSDAPRDAAFWSAVLGWEITYSAAEAAMVNGPTSALGFGTVSDYQPPAWPNEHGSKQFHFDLAVDDLAQAEQVAVGLGATVADPQPGETWRVLLDPAGHPFCLTKAENWG